MVDPPITELDEFLAPLVSPNSGSLKSGAFDLDTMIVFRPEVSRP